MIFDKNCPTSRLFRSFIPLLLHSSLTTSSFQITLFRGHDMIHLKEGHSLSLFPVFLPLIEREVYFQLCQMSISAISLLSQPAWEVMVQDFWKRAFGDLVPMTLLEQSKLFDIIFSGKMLFFRSRVLHNMQICVWRFQCYTYGSFFPNGSCNESWR